MNPWFFSSIAWINFSTSFLLTSQNTMRYFSSFLPFFKQLYYSLLCCFCQADSFTGNCPCIWILPYRFHLLRGEWFCHLDPSSVQSWFYLFSIRLSTFRDPGIFDVHDLGFSLSQCPEFGMLANSRVHSTGSILISFLPAAFCSVLPRFRGVLPTP